MLSPIDRKLQLIYLNRFIKKHVAHVKRNTKQRQRYHAKKRAILEKKIQEEAERIRYNNISIITETITVQEPEEELVNTVQEPEEELRNLTEDDFFCDETPEDSEEPLRNLTEDDFFCDETPEKPELTPEEPEEPLRNLTEDDFCDATPEKPRPSNYSYHKSIKFQNFFLDIMEELGLDYEHLPF